VLEPGFEAFYAVKPRNGSMVPTLTDKKSRTFPGLYRPPGKKVFQDLFRAHECSNIKKNGIYLQQSEGSPLQKV